ncbi:MAG: transporter permease [Xanthobacteraceae bacterium]|jgi:putative spermidine/putrescine transport system permease protein|nr:transporter permease [Xanthobacteraceae bacterium]
MRTGWGLPLYATFIGFLLLFPLAIVVAVSFDPGVYIRFPVTGFSPRWYVRMWADETIVLSIVNSLIVGFSSSLIGAIVAIPAALAVTHGGRFVKAAVYPFLLSPFAMPWLVYGLGILFFWGLTGLRLSLWTLIVGHTVLAIPYVLRVTLAVLRSMPPNLVRAARVAGASPWQAFRYVTLPYIRSGVTAGVSFALVVSLTNIPVSLFLTTADNITLPVAIFNYMINNFEPLVAAVSAVQVLMIGVIIYAARIVGGVDRA